MPAITATCSQTLFLCALRDSSTRVTLWTLSSLSLCRGGAAAVCECGGAVSCNFTVSHVRLIMFMRPHWLGRARCPRAAARTAVAARGLLSTVSRARRGGGRPRAPAPPGARASSPLDIAVTPHARAWRWIWRERERSRIRMLRAMRHGLHFSMQRERPRPHGHALHALIQEPRARRSTVAHAGEPSTYASSFLSHRAPPRSHGPSQPPGSQGLRQQAWHRPPA